MPLLAFHRPPFLQLFIQDLLVQLLKLFMGPMCRPAGGLAKHQQQQ